MEQKTKGAGGLNVQMIGKIDLPRISRGMLALVIFFLGSHAGHCSSPDELQLGTNHFQFDFTSDVGLQRVQRDLESLPIDDYAKKNRRGLQELERLTATALQTSDAGQRAHLINDLQETLAAVNNNQRPPVPAHLDGVQMPGAVWQLHRPIGKGKTPATDLAPGGSDLSLRDPLPSSFWRRPENIPGEDLYNGFGRAHFPAITDQICDYEAPKETYGMNPGFEVTCQGMTVKLKFGEISSEPFVTRIFWALGFNADPTDYSPGVKLHYDRRIFLEFNSRRSLRTRFTVFGVVPLYTMTLQRRADPFAYIAQAVWRDGSVCTGRELKSRLVDHGNFRPEIEAQINYLLTVPVNVQAKDPAVKSIGPWDYGQLDHADRREVRGAGLLAAWVGFFDTRFDNTRLRLVGPKRSPRLLHYFSDLGGGMGRTSGLLFWHGEQVAAFPWRFTKPPRGHHLLRLFGYKPIAPTPAFAAMTIDDARWMARLIAQLSEPQIVAALTASGYNAAEIRLYTEKLSSRRAHMMSDFGLANEGPSSP